MSKILVVDNYDSFTYNLVQLVRENTTAEFDVKRNDQFVLAEVENYSKILLSPGPGLPSEAGLMPALVKEYATQKSILGICLGHQCIGEVFGAELENLAEVYHGCSSQCNLLDQDNYLFQGLAEQMEIGRYHSWIVSRNNFPDCLKVTAEDENSVIMGLKHRKLDVQGLQFHPESVLTPEGAQIIKNWLNHE